MTAEAAGRLRAREGMVPKDGNVWRIQRFEIPADQQPTTLTVDGGRLAL
jgi:hypothetical protein